MPADEEAAPEDVDMKELEKTQQLLDEAAAKKEDGEGGAAAPAGEQEKAKAPKKKRGGCCCCCGGKKKAAEDFVEEEVPPEEPEEPVRKSLRAKLSGAPRSPGKVLADRRKAKEIVIDTNIEVAQRFCGLWVMQGLTKVDELMQQVGVSNYQQQAMEAVRYGAGRALMKVELRNNDLSIMDIEMFGMGKAVKQSIKIGETDYVSGKLTTFDGPLQCKAKWIDKKLELLVTTRWGQEVKQLRSVSADNEECRWEISYGGVTCIRYWRRIGMPASDESWNATCSDDPEEASETLQKLGPKVTRQETIELYGYFKQSLWGDAPEGGADTRLGALHVAKFNSWGKLRGMTKEAAQQEYVKRADKIVVREGGTLLSR
eukprot:g2917.t1